MMKYLYGASVQGIQDFIFKTNKLQEIVGASEIVKSIDNDFKEKFEKNSNVVILQSVAGNIKAIFKDKNELQEHILEFEKTIMQKAYGITISQAVIEFEDDEKLYLNKLATKLKIQRNKPCIPLDSSINIMKLNPTTAKPMVEQNQDIATKQKLEAYKNIKNKTNTDLSKISNEKNKIAIIHIDGNGLGELIPKLTIPLSEFSKKLDTATKTAFEMASKDKNLRKIILGGDDVTVVCSANDALSFTQEFLENFENETKKIEGLKNGLSACAGIAYCNKKYPFHYAVSLAEILCGVAKDRSDRKKSCLMFHNIQSSNIHSWNKIIEDELTIKNDKQIIRCDFGPYYLDKENKISISGLLNSINAYRCDGTPISRLRNWMSELHKSQTDAKNLLDRINTITAESGKWNSCIMDRNLKNIDQELSSQNLIINDKTPIYDILQILSVTTGDR